MSTNPTTIDTDPRAFLTELAAEVDAFGFTASVVDTGGGILCAAVELGSRVVTVTLDDGELVLAQEDADGAIGDEDGVTLSLAECVARAIVQRINCDDLG